MCGSQIELGEASKVLGYLRQSMDAFGGKAFALLGGDTHDLSLFGPFCARVIMETACAALIGRIDPFRVLYLSRFQSHAGYDPTKRAKSAFTWQGDVIPPEKEKDELWSEALETAKISRALFSQYTDHVIWRPAVSAAIDCAATARDQGHIAGILTTDIDSFIAQARGRGASLYSQLSKGVHWEFFTDNAVIFDRETVRQLIQDAIIWTSRLGLVSHFIPTAHGCLKGSEAISSYADVMELMNVG